MAVFFTADHHFGHKNILRFDNRPFASIDEMDSVLIDNWNRIVGKNDEVWHLGDFNFRSINTTDWYLKKLNGHIHIVWGNHDDKYAKNYSLCFKSHQDAKYLTINGQKMTLYHYSQRTWRSGHHGSWNLYAHSHNILPDDPTIVVRKQMEEMRRVYEAELWALKYEINLLKDEAKYEQKPLFEPIDCSPTDMAMDVGIDATAARLAGIPAGTKMPPGVAKPEDYRPISLNEVIKFMSTRKFVPVDGHYSNPDV